MRRNFRSSIRATIPSCLLFAMTFAHPCVSNASSSKSAQTGRTYKEFSSVTFSGDQNSPVIFISALQFLETQQNNSFLLRYNLKTGEENKAELPIALQGRTLVALYPVNKSNSKVYVVSQLHKAGADKPRVDLHDFSNGSWKLIKEDINCVSFSKLRLEASVLKMNCEENYLFPPDQERIRLVLGGAENPQLRLNGDSLRLTEDGKSLSVISDRTPEMSSLNSLLRHLK